MPPAAANGGPGPVVGAEEALRLASEAVRQKAVQLQLQYTLYKAAAREPAPRRHSAAPSARAQRHTGGGEGCLDDFAQFARSRGALDPQQLAAAAAEWARARGAYGSQRKIPPAASLGADGEHPRVGRLDRDFSLGDAVADAYTAPYEETIGGDSRRESVEGLDLPHLAQEVMRLAQLECRGGAGSDPFEGAPCSGFGELIFPSASDSGGLVRLDADSVHRHLVCILTNRDGEVEFWNERASVVTGIPPETAVGQNIAAFIPSPGEQETMRELIGQAAEEGADTGLSRPFAFVCSDGVNLTHLDLTVTGGPTSDNVAAIGVEALRETQHSDYLQWVLAHMGSCLGDLGQSSGGLVGAELQRLQQLLSQAGTVSMRHWGPLHLRTVLNKLVADFSEMSQEYGVSLQCGSVDAELPEEICTDRLQLPRAVAYIVNNAIRFSPRGGRVVISATAKLPTEGRPAGTVQINVEDRGPGLPEAVVRAVQKGDEEAAPGLVRTCVVIRELGGWWQVSEPAEAEKPQRPPLQGAEAAGTPKRNRRGAAGLTLFGVPVRDGDVQRGPGNESLGTDAGSVRGDGRGCVFSVVLPLLASSAADRDDQRWTPDGMALCFDTGMSGATAPAIRVEQRRGSILQDGQLVKCLLFEPNVVHRMGFCHHLWKRSYALSLAMGLQDFNQQVDDVDVVVADTDSEVINLAELLDRLRHSSAQVVLASRLFNELQKKEIKDANWHALTLPLRGDELDQTLDAVEHQILDSRQKRKQIEDLRRAFDKGLKHVPWNRGRVLGSGSFGKVYEATSKMTGGKMAVKAIPLGQGTQERECAVLREVQVMANLEHENIIHYFYSERTQDELLIFMEFATEGSLSAKIPKGGMSAHQASGYMEGILRGLQYLHNQKLVHRDIKVANVLLSHGVVKLTDFGTATDLRSDSRATEGVAGTPQYMAPEVLNAEPGALPGPEADIWAVGCLLMELCTALQPFAHLGAGSWVAVRYVSTLQDGDEVQLGTHPYHICAVEFLRQCLQPAPSKRPDCQRLLQSSLLGMNEAMMRKATVMNMAQLNRQESFTNKSFKRAALYGGTAPPMRSRHSTAVSLLTVRGAMPRRRANSLQATPESEAVQGLPPRDQRKSQTRDDARKTLPVIAINDDSDSGESDFSGWGGRSSAQELRKTSNTRSEPLQPRQVTQAMVSPPFVPAHEPAADAASGCGSGYWPQGRPGGGWRRHVSARPRLGPRSSGAAHVPDGCVSPSLRPNDLSPPLRTLSARSRLSARSGAHETAAEEEERLQQAEQRMTLSICHSFATRRAPDPVGRREGSGSGAMASSSALPTTSVETSG
eukprot:TRINITY_DN2432_c0_g1_i1.p1 TRINITY_DN2432_c0_g1~~TRINITY_DN2432_c0_g1_i1.p1  ORF type:complete len:1325 (+),score=408.68 TRINITY_DN2432_c0_g1_i1:102-4076(+)